MPAENARSAKNNLHFEWHSSRPSPWIDIKKVILKARKVIFKGKAKSNQNVFMQTKQNKIAPIRVKTDIELAVQSKLHEWLI